MLSPLLISVLIQISVVVILCVGFTFTYMMEKFPNFAHAAFATVGTVVSFTLVRFSGFNPYNSIPVSMLFCGLLGLVLYRFVVRPIKETGAREITLTFAFFVMAQILASLINIYSYWYLYEVRAPTSGFYFFSGDFKWEGYPGVLLVAVPMCLLLVISLWFFLTRVKQGIAFRAVAEDEALSSSLGINVEGIHLMSWFITGLLAGLAGGLIPLWRYTGLDANDQFLILVMTGSVLGGLNTVTGAIVGGVLVVTSQKIFTSLGVTFIGIDIVAYESLFPMVLVVLVLFLQPEGLMSIFDSSKIPGRPLTERVRNSYATLIQLIKKKK